VNETVDTPDIASSALAAPAPAREVPAALKPHYVWAVFAALAVVCAASLWLAWQSQQRVHGLEQELVRRQTDTQVQATEAQMLAKQAQDVARETAARLALLEARVSEVAVQRGQIEELIQSLSRSRDENIVLDIDSALRVAMQQAALTGSAEPLVATLKQADERLARYNQPRLEGVRRAIARDLDRVKAMGVIDIAAAAIKLDEAVRMVDELPLLSQAEPRKEGSRSAALAASAARPAQRGASDAAAPDTALPVWMQPWIARWDALTERVWGEARSLVRVTRIEHPEAMLIAPEQAYFLRENLKLRLLNARLALLSRQFDTAQGDLQGAQAVVDRYFDRGSRRTQLAAELIRQVAAQARQIGLPRPDNTLAALSAAAAGR
jgi:uroporphyrin-III C-methyltransferase